MISNRVYQAFQEGRPSFGTYVTTPSPQMIELLGFAGLDFVRIDMEGGAMNLETVRNMIRTAHAVGVTPFVRVPSERESMDWTIQAVLAMGALGIIVPRINNPSGVAAAVRAVKPPPLGECTVGSSAFSGGYGQVSAQEYADWAEKNIILSVQVETKSGVESIEEIVSVPGLDMVQSGRGDLSRQYGVPGEQYHPVVLQAQRTVVEAGLRAGKLVSVQYYPLRDPEQVSTVRDFIRQGIHCLSLGSDKDIIAVFRRLLADLSA